MNVRQMLSYESLEMRLPLAANVSVVHDPFPQAELGDLVERVIRVFSEEAADVSIVSELSNELDDATWSRVQVGLGQGFEEDYFARQPDFRLNLSDDAYPQPRWNTWDAEFLQELGDVDGDGMNDAVISVQKQPGEELIKYLVYGGPDRDVELDGEDGNSVLKLDSSLEFNPLGDINADGLDDWSAGNRIIFGSPRAPGEQPLATASVVSDVGNLFGVGDLNGGAIDDFVATCPPPNRSSSCSSFGPNPTYLLFGRRGLHELSPQLVASEIVNSEFGVVFPQFDTQVAGAAGDFNGDGIDDAILIPSADLIFTSPEPVVVYGSRTLEFSTVVVEGFSTLGTELNGNFLYDFAGAADLNNE